MDYKPTLHITNFSDRVRGLNQLKNQELRLTAQDANNLLSDITTMLAEIARLSIELHDQNNQSVQIEVDGGGFK
jgi:hypothetical protein